MKLKLFINNVPEQEFANYFQLIEYTHKYFDCSLITLLEQGGGRVTMEDETGCYNLKMASNGTTTFNKITNTETNANTETNEAES